MQCLEVRGKCALCSASRVAAGEIICIYMEVSSKKIL